MTRFYTINGQILYQKDSSGNRTEYVHDALGSVIATTDANRNAQNTYRWAPYGTQIDKTGTEPDPDFRGLGTLGYRATGRAHAGSYVRRRTFGSEQSSWTSVDLYWLPFGAYSYCGAHAVDFGDPTGADWPAAKRIQFGGVDCDGGACGGCDVKWSFEITGGTSETLGWTGWLIQKVTNTYAFHCCEQETYGKPKGCIVPSETNSGSTQTYYEAWFIYKGLVMNPDPSCTQPAEWVPAMTDYNDDWNLTSGGNCSTGSSTRVGSLIVWGTFGSSQLPSPTQPTGFAVDPASCAGCLPISATFPNADFGSQACQRNYWSCCGAYPAGTRCGCNNKDNDCEPNLCDVTRNCVSG